LRVLYVAQQVGEGERIEPAVSEGHLLGPPRHQPDLSRSPELCHRAPALAQHVEGEVDADHLRARPVGQLEGDPRRPRGHVEHECGIADDDVVDHRPPPPSVLSHREPFGEAVVPVGERREEVPGEPVRVEVFEGVHPASSRRLFLAPPAGAKISP
jgi:hypothetical protein